MRDGLTVARAQLAKALVREAGELAQRLRVSGLSVHRKSDRDYCSNADIEVEQWLVERLTHAFPQDAVFAEESSKSISDDGTWVIDPIDGTTNFLCGSDLWCVSVGWLYQGVRELGVVYAPDRNELYSAMRGGGSFLGPGRIDATASLRCPRTVLVGHSERTPLEAYLGFLRSSLAAGFEHRRIGSAALGLTWTARGWASAFFEAHLNAWDSAAGLLICEEAGCALAGEMAQSTPKDGGPVLTAHPSLLQEIPAALAGLSCASA